MANTSSALKAQRQAERRTARNRPIRSSVRTITKKASTAVHDGSEQAGDLVQQMVSALDKAAQKGVIHPNNAARHKSRIMRQLSAAVGDAAPRESVAPVKGTKKVTRRTTSKKAPSTTSTTGGRLVRAAAATRTAAQKADAARTRRERESSGGDKS